MKRKGLSGTLFGVVILAATLLPMFMSVGEAVAPKVSSAAAERETLVSGKPVRIVIDSLHINLPIVDGVYSPVNKTWTLNQDAVQYATVTPLANNTAGNTFIYGHATKVLFGRMVAIQPGAIAAITTSNGDIFYYQYDSSVDVRPGDVNTIKYSGPSQLTVQTCVGTYYQDRRMFHFKFVRVETPSSEVKR